MDGWVDVCQYQSIGLLYMYIKVNTEHFQLKKNSLNGLLVTLEIIFDDLGSDQ